MSIKALSYKQRTLQVIVLLIAGIVIIAAFVVDTEGPGTDSLVAGTPPYLVVDLQKLKITVRLTDVVLREYNFTILGDSNQVEKTVSQWSGPGSDTLVIKKIYLLSATSTISPQELTIIAEETRIKADQIQRYIPKHLVVVTDGPRLHIVTDCSDAKSFLTEQIAEGFWRIWHKLMGRDSLRLRLSEEDAMSLYGVVKTHPGVILR